MSFLLIYIDLLHVLIFFSFATNTLNPHLYYFQNCSQNPTCFLELGFLLFLFGEGSLRKAIFLSFVFSSLSLLCIFHKQNNNILNLATAPRSINTEIINYYSSREESALWGNSSKMRRSAPRPLCRRRTNE